MCACMCMHVCENIKELGKTKLLESIIKKKLIGLGVKKMTLKSY